MEIFILFRFYFVLMPLSCSDVENNRCIETNSTCESNILKKPTPIYEEKKNSFDSR